MTAKLNKATSSTKTGGVLSMTARKGKTAEEDIAWVLLDPLVIAGSFLADQNKQFPNVDVTAFAAEVRVHADAVKRGDLSRGEEMLTAQAHSLNSLFYSLANRSAANSKGGYLDAAAAYMKLAMRAQSQCRSTWEAVAEIKNPRQVAFVTQANMGQNVQVNNAAVGSAPPPRAEHFEMTHTEQSGGDLELLPDSRASTPAGGIDPPLETLGKFDRTEVGGR